MQLSQIWNHYKTLPEWKDKLIFFVTWTFYSTFWSDAIFLSQIFDFKIVNKAWADSVWFPTISWEKYFSALENAWYSYVVILVENSEHSVVKYYIWDKPLELTIPIEVYNWLLKELKDLIHKYEAHILLMKDVSLPLDESIWFTPAQLPKE